MSRSTTLLTVTDLHRNAGLLAALGEATGQHKPDVVALVGDFLHGFDDREGRVTAEDCAKLLSELPCADIVFVRGNHEDEAWWPFTKEWNKSGRPMHALGGRKFPEHIVEILIRWKINQVIAAASAYQCSDNCDHLSQRFGPTFEMGLKPIVYEYSQMLRREW